MAPLRTRIVAQNQVSQAKLPVISTQLFALYSSITLHMFSSPLLCYATQHTVSSLLPASSQSLLLATGQFVASSFKPVRCYWHQASSLLLATGQFVASSFKPVRCYWQQASSLLLATGQFVATSIKPVRCNRQPNRAARQSASPRGATELYLIVCGSFSGW